MVCLTVVGNLKEEFIKFLESTIEFYSTLVEQLQLNEGSKRKVVQNCRIVNSIYIMLFIYLKVVMLT